MTSSKKSENEIIGFSLQLKLKTKAQAVNIIKDIIKLDTILDVGYRLELLHIGEQHVVSIVDGSWAGNLKAIAKICQKYDMEMD